MKKNPCSWIERLNIVKMALLPKAIYRFITIPTKIPTDVYVEIDKVTLKFTCKYRGPRITKTILKKNKDGGFTFPYFKTYYKATLIKILWYWHKYRHTDQWNRLRVQK